MPKTLLLADDSITIQKVVGIIFKGEDYSVASVDNGEDALSRVRELRPDVLLADVVMPRKNGYELCEAVKNDPELRATPVLLLAGTFEAFDEARARAVRADGWIQKPFESAALLGKIREIVEGISAPARPGAPLPPFAAPQRPSSPPFAARNTAVPVPPPPPSFAARPPQPPAPPPPPPPAPSVARDAPAFSAPRPPQPPVVPAAPSFAAPPTAVVVPFPPPPPPPPTFELAPLPPDFDVEPDTGLNLGVAPPPAVAPAAPAIPTQKVVPVMEPVAELDFDIDEAAAPIDLEDLAAEEITEEEALLVDEPHDQAPLSTVDLFGDEARTPPPIDFAAAPPTETAAAPVPEALPDDETFGEPSSFEPFATMESLGTTSDDPFAREPMPFRTELDLAPEPEPEQPQPEPELAAEPQLEAAPQLVAEPQPAGELEVEAPGELLAEAVPAEEAAPLAATSAADEAILRDVLSRASRETIERVVWDVVPQLAEAIIREHLEQLVRDRKNS